MSLVDLGPRGELWSGEMRVVRAGGRRVLLVNVDEEVVAYEDACRHLGLSLESARLEGGVLRCAHHGWEYDARTGLGCNPVGECLKRFPIEIRAGRIMVDVTGGDDRA
jgi:nitrite reductase/ring-hydroxylating ferredoxin subunit